MKLVYFPFSQIVGAYHEDRHVFSMSREEFLMEFGMDAFLELEEIV